MLATCEGILCFPKWFLFSLIDRANQCKHPAHSCVEDSAASRVGEEDILGEIAWLIHGSFKMYFFLPFLKTLCELALVKQIARTLKNVLQAVFYFSVGKLPFVEPWHSTVGRLADANSNLCKLFCCQIQFQLLPSTSVSDGKYSLSFIFFREFPHPIKIAKN